MSDKMSVKYGRIELVNGKDVLQYSGEDLDEISLSIQYAIEFCDPATEIEALKQSMRDAEVLPFLFGDGTIVGKYVITSLDLTYQKTSPIGVLESATVAVTLLEYAYGEPVKPKGIAVVTPSTTELVTDTDIDVYEDVDEDMLDMYMSTDEDTTTVPAAETPAPPAPTPARGISKLITKGRDAVNKIKSLGEKVKQKVSDVKSLVQDVKNLANEAKDAYAAAKEQVEVAIKIYERAKDLPGSLDEAIKYAKDLAEMKNDINAEDLKKNIDQLVSSTNTVTKNATSVVSFIATKEGGE